MPGTKHEANAALQVCTLILNKLLELKLIEREEVIVALEAAGAKVNQDLEVRVILRRVADGLAASNVEQVTPAPRRRRPSAHLPIRRRRALHG